MLTRIKITNFASIQSLELELDSFHGLVGPNGTGKSTLFNALKFLADIVENGVYEAFDEWGFNYHDLTFCGNGEPINFELEAQIPKKIKKNKDKLSSYSLEIKYDADHSDVIIEGESLVFIKGGLTLAREQLPSGPRNLEHMPLLSFFWRYFLHTVEEEERATPEWFYTLLTTNIKKYTLDNASLRKVSTSGKGNRLHPTGANLARHLRRIKEKDADLFTAFVEHIQTALPDVKDFLFYDRSEDRAVYFKILYQNGAEVPQWLVSDGSLRLIALSSLAYDPEQSGILMVEEPENGLHPLAIETVIQSLSSVYGAQVFISTHSPIVMNLIPLAQLLCFSKDEKGACHIIKGDRHPVLSQWKDGVNLDAIYAAGILG